MGHPKKPCKGCPYARATIAGELRGQDVRRFIAQATGPFVLPCHRVEEQPSGDKWSAVSTSKPQCAGSAMFRSALFDQGLLPPLPAPLYRLPVDPKLVFTSPADFVSHHEGERVTVSSADIQAWLNQELTLPGVRPASTD